MNAIDITGGRTAIKALLITAVLTVGIVGGIGTAAAEPIDGKGNDVYPPPGVYTSLDGKGNDVYPPPGVYASLDGKGNDVPTLPPSRFSFDGAGHGVLTAAFPIDNVTVFSATYAGRGGGSGKPSF
jgi:hypothetical protein